MNEGIGAVWPMWSQAPGGVGTASKPVNGSLTNEISESQIENVYENWVLFLIGHYTVATVKPDLVVESVKLGGRRDADLHAEQSV